MGMVMFDLRREMKKKTERYLGKVDEVGKA